MKVKVSEATRHQIDWLAAKADGYDEGWLNRQAGNPNPETRAIPKYCTDWSQGGPIIEKHGIWLRKIGSNWEAISGWFPAHILVAGPVPLETAMRCFVASQLGNEVEIPESLEAGGG